MNILIQMFTEQAMWVKIYMIIALYSFIAFTIKSMRDYVVEKDFYHDLLVSQLVGTIMSIFWPIMFIISILKKLNRIE